MFIPLALVHTVAKQRRDGFLSLCIRYKSNILPRLNHYYSKPVCWSLTSMNNYLQRKEQQNEKKKLPNPPFSNVILALVPHFIPSHPILSHSLPLTNPFILPLWIFKLAGAFQTQMHITRYQKPRVGRTQAYQVHSLSTQKIYCTQEKNESYPKTKEYTAAWQNNLQVAPHASRRVSEKISFWTSRQSSLRHVHLAERWTGENRFPPGVFPAYLILPLLKFY